MNQVVDLRTRIQYHRVPVNANCFVFGDNQADVTNTSITTQYNVLAYHCVEEMIDAKIV
jgi:hypothetical protein